MEDRTFYSICVAAILLAILASAYFFWIMYKDIKQWDDFKQKHNCKVAGKQSSSVGYGYGMTTSGKIGLGTVIIPGKTTWLCDDGISYTR